MSWPLIKDSLDSKQDCHSFDDLGYVVLPSNSWYNWCARVLLLASQRSEDPRTQGPPTLTNQPSSEWWIHNSSHNCFFYSTLWSCVWMSPLSSIRLYKWKSRPGYDPVSKPIYERDHSMDPEGAIRRVDMTYLLWQAGNRERHSFPFTLYITHVIDRGEPRRATCFLLWIFYLYLLDLIRVVGIRKKW